MKLHTWGDINTRFRDNLLLGNGASIAIDARLSYKSLLDEVLQARTLEDDLVSMFDYFHTSDFELILRLLLQTRRVNEVLAIKDDKTRDYYYALRDALISTVRDIHPTYENVEQLLSPIAEFLGNFSTVLSLNYDLLVYWAMQVGNDDRKCTWFKDCFVHGAFEKDFHYLYSPHPPAEGSTLVFYPHGSLVIATDFCGNEVKLSRSKEDCLLDAILSRWGDKDYVPLFVSEGDTREKLRAITRSSYLNTVYDSVLSRLKGSLAVFGWSGSEQDDHIFRAIDRGGISDIAVSVYTRDPDWESYCDRFDARIAQTRHIRHSGICYFDAESQGCWVH